MPQRFVLGVFAFLVGLALHSTSLGADATLQLLPDFNQTHSLSDVVHLGDNTNKFFLPASPSGTSLTLTFELPCEPSVGSEITLLIDQYNANNGFLDIPSRVLLNGVLFGPFSADTTFVDLTGSTTLPVVTDTFSIDPSILLVGTNTLVIDAGHVDIPHPDVFDDLSITNVRIVGLSAGCENTGEMLVTPDSVWANGHESAEVSVTVNGPDVSDHAVTLTSDRPEDVIEPAEAGSDITDASGEARFIIKSTRLGIANLTATISTTDPPLTLTGAVEFVERRIVIFIQGVNTHLVDGQESAFTFIKSGLVANGYQASDFLEYSYMSGQVDPADGTWKPSDYSKFDTGQSLEISINFLKNMILLFDSANPNTRFVVVGHSQGGLLSLRALELVPAAPQIDAIVTLDGALGGVPLRHSMFLATTPWFLGPARFDLDDLWQTATGHDQQGTSASNNQALVAAARGAGTKIFTIGSSDDCVFDPSDCGVPIPPDNASTQVVGSANIVSVLPLGGNCSARLAGLGVFLCALDSHSRVRADCTAANLLLLAAEPQITLPPTPPKPQPGCFFIIEEPPVIS